MRRKVGLGVVFLLALSIEASGQTTPQPGPRDPNGKAVPKEPPNKKRTPRAPNRGGVAPAPNPNDRMPTVRPKDNDRMPTAPPQNPERPIAPAKPDQKTPPSQNPVKPTGGE